MMQGVSVQPSFYGNYRVVIWFGVVIAAMLASFYILKPVIVYLLIAFILYALFEPLTSALIRRGMGQGLAAFVVTLLVCAFFVVVMSTLLPRLTAQFEQMLHQWPQVMGAVREKLSTVMLQWGMADGGALMDNAVSRVQSQLGEMAIEYGSGAAISLLYIIVLVPLITFFLFRDFRKFRNWVLSRLPNASFELVCLIYYRIIKKLQGYVRGVILQSTIVAIVCSVGFYLAGFDSWILLAVMAGLLNIIPYVGPLLAMVMPVLIAVSSVPIDSFMLLTAVITLLTAQLVDNLLIVPLVIANSVNMHPLVVMLGLIIFGSFMGPLGMIIAIPLMVTIGLVYTGLQNGLRALPGD